MIPGSQLEQWGVDWNCNNTRLSTVKQYMNILFTKGLSQWRIKMTVLNQLCSFWHLLSLETKRSNMQYSLCCHTRAKTRTPTIIQPSIAVFSVSPPSYSARNVARCTLSLHLDVFMVVNTFSWWTSISCLFLLSDQRLDLNKLGPNDNDTVRGQIVGKKCNHALP